jgi:hypothetical protein
MKLLMERHPDLIVEEDPKMMNWVGVKWKGEFHVWFMSLGDHCEC